MEVSSSTLGLFLGVGAAISWAIGSTVIATLTGRASSGALNFFKFAFGGIALLVLDVALHGTGVLTHSTRAWRLMALSAVVGLGIGDNLYYRAIETLGVGRAMIFLSTAPVFATFLGAIFLGERATIAFLVGTGITLSGVLLVVLARTIPGRAAVTREGVLYGVGAGVCQAIGSLFSRSAMNEGLPAFSSSWMRLLIALVASFGFGLATRSIQTWVRSLWNREVLPRMAASTMVGIVFGLAAAQGAIKYCASTGVASTLLAMSPVFVLPLAHYYANERITARAAIGATIAVLGVFVLAMAPR